MSTVQDLLVKLKIPPGTYSFGLFHILAYPPRLIPYPPGDGFMIILDFLTEIFPETEFNYWEARMAAGCLKMELTDEPRVIPENFKFHDMELNDIFLVLRIYYRLGLDDNEIMETNHELGINVLSVQCSTGNITYIETFAQRGTIRPISKIIVETQGAIAKISPNREYNYLPKLSIPSQN